MMANRNAMAEYWTGIKESVDFTDPVKGIAEPVHKREELSVHSSISKLESQSSRLSSASLQSSESLPDLSPEDSISVRLQPCLSLVANSLNIGCCRQSTIPISESKGSKVNQSKLSIHLVQVGGSGAHFFTPTSPVSYGF
jgi:hypothetical protein